MRSSTRPEQIYHIVRTVVEPGGFVKGEIPEECPTCGQSIKTEVPSLRIAARPNLYVFEHSVAGWLVDLSPLAARQYEKINPQQKGDDPYEYHRVHPLYKEGIRKETFGWIRWYYSGKVEWENVHSKEGWRGKTFWTTTEEIALEEEERLRSHYTDSLRMHLHRYT